MYRVGMGYDIHPQAPEGGAARPLILGGVEFPGERGLAGHSDADVVTHAVCDALLGALALGDLGQHFPDTDPAWKGASSLDLLARVVNMVEGQGWRASNVDVTVIAERPKIAPLAGEMRKAIASVMGTEPGEVSIKATRPEGMGALGGGEGIACLAVAAVRRAGPPGTSTR